MTRCLVCLHQERKSIEDGILRAQPLKSLGLSYGLSAGVVGKHKRKCMPAVVAAAVTYTTVQAGFDTLARAQNIALEAERLRNKAESSGDLRTAMVGLREEARGTELAARLAGELQTADGPLTDPRWFRLRDAIVEALRPFPEAARAVNAALAGMSTAPVARLPSSTEED